MYKQMTQSTSKIQTRMVTKIRPSAVANPKANASTFMAQGKNNALL